MKILYLIEWNAYIDSGVVCKVNAQVKQWLDLGKKVKLLVLTPSADTNTVLFQCADIKIVKYKSFSFFTKLFKSIALLKTRKEISSFIPDVTYYRQSSWTPGISLLLKMNRVLIIEINSDDISETKHYGNLRYMYHLYTRKWIINKADGFVCVSNELAKIYETHKKPIVTIGNGFDIDSVIPRVPSSQLPIKGVFVCSKGQKWHGVDILVLLAQKLPEIEFHVVGLILDNNKIPSNVISYGQVSWKILDRIYQKMDFGVGTLALFRNDMNEASPLKVREYLAYGLPVIGSYYDTDISGEDYYLECSNTPQGIFNEVKQIESFIKKWKGIMLNRNKIKAKIGIYDKEKLRLNFMNRVLNAKIDNNGQKKGINQLL